MKKLLRGFLRIVLILIILLVLGFVFAYATMNEDAPVGEKGPKAEQLTDKMLAAINNEGWKQTHYISWSFPGGHYYVWDRVNDIVEIKWGDKTAILPTKNPTSGMVFENGTKINDPGAVETAWAYFCNDSFWLIAPHKAKDPGVERSVVTLDDGSEALMVHYTSGGTTPGDKYLWILDENYVPTSYKMWVSIIPIGGVEASWDGWITLPSGGKVSATHSLGGLITTDLSPVKAGSSLTDLGLAEDYFSGRM
ncbi:MAG: hypothetical protein HRT74_11240 [Flavobacteriales bacterium]|nr:hypothetical protein [Flavobacteriales bacterium]